MTVAKRCPVCGKWCKIVDRPIEDLSKIDVHVKEEHPDIYPIIASSLFTP